MEINLLAVMLSAVAAFFLGFIWYTVVFVKPWQKEIGMGENAANTQPANLGKFLATSFLLELIMAFVLASLIGTQADALSGLRVGVLIGLPLVGFAFGVNYLFEGKSFKHWLINAGYNTVVFAVMGLIIGLL